MSRTEQYSRAYFRASSDLAAARSSIERDEALDELVAMWLHCPVLKLQARCAALLQQHGRADQMQDLCESWAQ